MTNTYTRSCKTRESHRRQQWPAHTCGLMEGKRDLVRWLITHYSCNHLRKKSPAQPWENITTPETRWGGKLQLEDTGPGGALRLPVRGTTVQVGSACAPWVATDPAAAGQVSTRSQRDFRGGKMQGVALSPTPANEIGRKAMLIWVASTCESATVRFVSWGEVRRGGRKGRQVGHKAHEGMMCIFFFVVDFFVCFFFP